MQPPQAFDIKPANLVTPKKPFQSDASCFSPLADKSSAPAPTCARCGQKQSVGGIFEELDSGYPTGQVTGTVEFVCENHGQKVFGISVANLAQWQLFGQVRPGVFRVKKKTEAERIRELNAGQ